MDQQVSTVGSVFKKNIYLLKPENVTRRDNEVLLPHLTTDMNRLRRTEQFKTGVEFDKSVSADVIRRKLEQTFPELINKRYSCAARAAQSGIILEFHGARRVWDGATIKRKLRGASALYIVVEDETSQVPGPATVTSSGLTGAADSGNHHPVNRNPVDTAILSHAVTPDLKDVYPGSFDMCTFQTSQVPGPAAVTSGGLTGVAVSGNHHPVGRNPLDTVSLTDAVTPDLKEVYPGSFNMCTFQGSQVPKPATVKSVGLTGAGVSGSHYNQSIPEDTGILTDAVPPDLQDVNPGRFLDLKDLVDEFLEDIQKGEQMNSHGSETAPPFAVIQENNESCQVPSAAAQGSERPETGYSSAGSSSQDQELGQENAVTTVDNRSSFEVLAPTARTSEICQAGYSSEEASSSQNQEIDKEVAVVIDPDSGSVNGGTPFSLNNLQVDSSVSYLLVSFGAKQVGAIREYGGNSWLGKSPSGEPGPVIVTVTSGETGANLGDSTFTYVTENGKEKTNKQSVNKKRELEKLNYLLNDMARSIKKLKTDDCSEGDGILDFQQQGLQNQAKQLQLEDILRSFVYVAAETGARELIEVLFSFSFGKIVFEAYKNECPLPENIAEDNGHNDIAAYLRGVTKRYSKEDSTCPGQSKVIDWLELANALEEINLVQSEPSSDKDEMWKDDISETGYSADGETSSSDLENEKSDSDDEYKRISISTDDPSVSFVEEDEVAAERSILVDEDDCSSSSLQFLQRTTLGDKIQETFNQEFIECTRKVELSSGQETRNDSRFLGNVANCVSACNKPLEGEKKDETQHGNESNLEGKCCCAGADRPSCDSLELPGNDSEDKLQRKSDPVIEEDEKGYGSESFPSGGNAGKSSSESVQLPIKNVQDIIQGNCNQGRYMMEYSQEQLNYFRLCYLGFNLVPVGLRQIFKNEWDFRYETGRLGKWKDTTQNGLDFYNNESRRSQRQNARCLAIVKNGNTTEWDCTCLFFAILYSDSIGTTLGLAVNKNVEDIRHVRNDIAHISDAKLTDADFQSYVGRVINAFTSLGLPTNHIEDIKNRTSFPTEEVEKLKKQVLDFQTTSQSTEAELGFAKEKNKTLAQEISYKLGSFCFLKSTPPHEVIRRSQWSIWNEYQKTMAQKHREVTKTRESLGYHKRATITAKVAGRADFSTQEIEPDQGADTRWTDTSSDFQKDKRRDQSCMVRAEKAKASRGALHKSSISGHYETVKMLLDSGEDVDQRDQFSLTPLHLACWYGQESVVKLLLEHGANINALDKFCCTPLQKAERHNHQSIVQFLLKSNANPSYQQPLSLKALSRKAFLDVDRRSGFSVLQAAVFEGNYDIVSKAHALLGDFVKGMSLKTTGNEAKLFPGKTAVDILSSLKEKEKRPGHADINTFYLEQVKKYATLTELHRCRSGNDAEQAVELVLNDGVDINIPALCNRTPLLWASSSSSSMFIKTLIDLGADVNAQRTDDKVTPLMLATNWHNYVATLLLLEHGADADIQNIHGTAPLHGSASNGLYELSQLLIGAGGSINLRGKYNRTPLFNAVTNGHEHLVKLSLENKADADIEDINGDTPLHKSANGGHFNISQFLIGSGCRINPRNKESRTPLYFAVKNKQEQLVKLLLESNADVSMTYKENPENRIYLVRGKDRGKLAWHYVLVEKHLLGLFLKRTNGGSLDVADFGNILGSGWGKDPPKNTIDKILKKHECDAMFKEIPGETLLHVASRNTNTEIIHLLVKYGMWNVNVRDGEGFTPLHMAAIHGDMQVVKKLVDLEADVNLSTADGKDAVDLAHLNEEAGIEEYLKSKMASSQRTKEKEVDQGATLANILTEAYSFVRLQYIYCVKEALEKLNF